jgi:uncharacterized protein YecT (DUF1311 family)
MKRTCWILLTLLSMSAVGQAASFDCKKATTRVEKFICEDDILSELDEEMGAAYAKARRETHDRKLLARQQSKWLVERNACGDGESCLVEMYELRIEELLSGRGAGQVSKEFKGEFILTRNIDPVCVPFRSNLNEFRRIDFDECHPRLSDKYPQFSRPEWKEVPLDLAVAEAKIKGIHRPESLSQAEQRWQKWLKATESLRAKDEVRMWIAEVDADSDGVIDLVAKLQYSNPDGALSNLTKSCDYSHNALWLLRAADEDKRKLFNTSLGYSSDIVVDEESATTYILEWWPRDVGPEYMGRNIGATRGVRVSRARNWGPVPMCHINWVPEGRFRFPGDYEPLQR